jgi:hypothetical protein
MLRVMHHRQSPSDSALNVACSDDTRRDEFLDQDPSLVTCVCRSVALELLPGPQEAFRERYACYVYTESKALCLAGCGGLYGCEMLWIV